MISGERLLSLKATAFRYSQTHAAKDARILAEGAAEVLHALDAKIERLTKERNDARALVRAHIEGEDQ